MAESGEGQRDEGVVYAWRPKRSRWRSVLWLGVLAAGCAAAGALFRNGGGAPVAVVAPRLEDVTESIATSGTVAGHFESTVGADAQGTVTSLLVDENDVVHRGQLLAVVQRQSAESQVQQAAAGVDTALAQLRQARAGSTAEEIRVDVARLREAETGVLHAMAAAEHARIAAEEAAVAVDRMAAALAGAKANEAEAASRSKLASRNLDRTKELEEQGAVPESQLDEARSAFEVAEATVGAAAQATRVANEQARQAGLERDAASSALREAEIDVRSARHSREAAKADLDRLRTLPRPEPVAVAEARVRESEAALAAAKSSARNFEIRAPYDGVVTQILARPGVGVSQGVLRLVDSSHLEIDADVDESNLARLRVGERAVLATSSAPDRPIGGRVVRLSSQVEANKGAVQVVSRPVLPIPGLRPGQRVDVTIIVAERARRWMVPITAVRRTKDETIVLVVESGRARARAVRTGLESANEIAILSGVSDRDRVIRDAGTIEAGARVKVSR
jgi:RND family efflux transporter MFP subunit